MAPPRPPAGKDDWGITLRYSGGWRPWHAHITRGVMKLGEPGSTTYPARTPEGSLRKALKTVAKLAPNSHPEEIRITVTRDSDWAERAR